MIEINKKTKFRSLSFENHNYDCIEPFNVADDNEFYKENNLKFKKEKKTKLINSIKLNIYKILFILFFIFFLISLNLIIKWKRKHDLLENKLMDHIFSPYHSDLIPNLKVLKIIKTWIQTTLYNNTRKLYTPTLSMCYKATVDGDKSENFHSRTDEWKGYVVIIEDTYDNVFGGYTSTNFKSNHVVNLTYPSPKKDENSFLFSLSENEIYPLIKNISGSVIYGDDEEGPVFGLFPDADIRIVSNFLSRKSESDFPNFYADINGNKNQDLKLKLTKGNKEFFVKELEIFKVNLK